MEQNDLYVCPRCGEKGNVGAIVPLIGNVRYDAVMCQCGAEWRVYYTFADAVKEVTYMPRDEKEQNTDTVEE